MLRAVGDEIHRAEFLEQQLAEEKNKNFQLQQQLDSIITSHWNQIMDIPKKYDASLKKAKDLAVENNSKCIQPISRVVALHRVVIPIV